MDYDRGDIHFFLDDVKQWATYSKRMDMGELVEPRPTRKLMSVSMVEAFKKLGQGRLYALC